METLTDMHCM